MGQLPSGKMENQGAIAAAAGRSAGDARPTVLVLGAGGFIGCHLTKRLVDDGMVRVTAVDLHPEKLERMSGPTKVLLQQRDSAVHHSHGIHSGFSLVFSNRAPPSLPFLPSLFRLLCSPLTLPIRLPAPLASMLPGTFLCKCLSSLFSVPLSDTQPLTLIFALVLT